MKIMNKKTGKIGDSMQILIENALDEEIEVSYLKVIEDAIKQTAIAMAFEHDYEVSVTLVSEEEICQMNAEFRNKDTVTDVLSFPLIDYEIPGNFSHIHHMGLFYNHDTVSAMLGDIVICYEQALIQANAYGHSPERELAFLTVHSMLHLFGFDHEHDDEEGVMFSHQERILEEMGLAR